MCGARVPWDVRKTKAVRNPQILYKKKRVQSRAGHQNRESEINTDPTEKKSVWISILFNSGYSGSGILQNGVLCLNLDLIITLLYPVFIILFIVIRVLFQILVIWVYLNSNWVWVSKKIQIIRIFKFNPTRPDAQP